MDVTRRDLHHLFDVASTFPNHMGVLCVRHIHLQSHLVHLGLIWTEVALSHQIILNHFYNIISDETKGRR